MKDRLIELLLNVDYTLNTDGRKAKDSAEFIADYLLANGIIVPPCKVGDTVWFIKSLFTLFSEPKSETVKTILMAGYDTIFKTQNRAFNDTAIGKTVFLTREEAEQALKGGKQV